MQFDRMPQCVFCQGQVHRSRRSLFDRLVYEVVFRCEDCNRRFGLPKAWTFAWRPYVNCPKCGQTNLDRRTKRDHIDRMHRHPISRIQQLLFAPLYHCHLCRLQFYDWRPVKAPVAGESR
ncbi:MAG: hypothetical protein IT168_03525 [Bryobacterales bacterium]|nr:hypothetical protein [Bryobacterales bacterium]